MPVLPNARHERFAQELAKGKTADEAYENAGYQANRHNASRLKTNEHILSRIVEIQERGAEKAAVTVETIANQLDEDRTLARECRQTSAAVSASVAKAKLFGLMPDKHEVTGKDGGPIQHDVVTREAIEREISDLFADRPKISDTVVH